MTGKPEVDRLRQQLDATFGRARRLAGDAELQSDFARYLCVLVSGFLEKAVFELLMEYVRKHSDKRVQPYMERKLRRTTNLKRQRLLELFGAFDPAWGRDLDGFLVNEFKDAVDGIVDLRNGISHGGQEAVTMVRVDGYYKRIKVVVEHVSTLCLPEAAEAVIVTEAARPATGAKASRKRGKKK